MKRNDLLREIYSDALKKNVKYSLRRFAKDYGINVATCSRVLANVEVLSFFQIRKLLLHPKIDLTTKERLRSALFEDSEEQSTPTNVVVNSKFTDVEVQFDFEWTDLALMELLQIPGIDCTIDALARQLEMRTADIVPAIERLERKGLIAQKGEHYEKTHKRLIIGANQASAHRAREYQRNFTLRGLKVLSRTEPVDVDQRLMNTYMITTNPSKIAAAKELQLKFQKELIDLLTDCEPTCLYGLSTLFFPITGTETVPELPAKRA